jgi:hypothetical protein
MKYVDNMGVAFMREILEQYDGNAARYNITVQKLCNK